MQSLDLVIAPDTSIAHLAGALGRSRLACACVRAGLAMAPGTIRQPVVSFDAAVSTDAAGRLG